MDQSNSLSSKQIHQPTLIRHLLVGAGTAFFLILLFLFGTGEPDPSWAKYWMLRPLVIVPIAGALGGMGYYFINYHIFTNKALSVIIGILGFFIVLWMGFVLGLDGTMWD